jgi:hypothetical protein
MGMPAKGFEPTIVAASNGPVFDSVGVEQLIEIQVEGEDGKYSVYPFAEKSMGKRLAEASIQGINP